MDIVEHLPSYERHMSSFQVELDSKLKERKSRALASDLIIDQSEGQDERYDGNYYGYIYVLYAVYTLLLVTLFSKKCVPFLPVIFIHNTF